MEIQEEVVVVCKDQAQIMRGKRTKRQRTPSPLRLAIAMPSTSSSAGRTSTDCSGGFDLANTSSPATTSGELRDSTTEEEEDMANCLILLAQGKSLDPVAATKDGVYIYQCKTCERCFPSFQALGGHRASHKKLKPNPEEKQVGYDYCTSTALSLQLSNRASLYCGKSKVHECSVCGAEFSSGQALGGHMRRHRTFVNASTSTASPVSQDAKKPRNVFKLDLNLPAPEDHDHTESKSPFHSKDTVLVFSTSPLVDCHY